MKKKLLILICSVTQFTSMVYGLENAEDRPHFRQSVWPIRRQYKECLEEAVPESTLFTCRTQRDEALARLEEQLGLPQGELQRRMDQRAERRHQGSGRGERQFTNMGYGLENAENRSHFRQSVWPIRRQYRECLEEAVPENILFACRTQRDEALASLEEELGLPQGELQRRMDQRVEHHHQGSGRCERQ